MIILILSLAVALCFAALAAYAWMRWQRLAHDVRALELEEFAYNHVPRGLKGFDEGVFHAGLGEGLGAE